MLPDFKLGPLVLKTIHAPAERGWTPYLTRLTLGRAALHVFHRGDGDQECHDHPWDFWTFPVWSSYREAVRQPDGSEKVGLVPRWRWSFRPATYAHRVLDPLPGERIVTLIWKSRRKRSWGFYCPAGWKAWESYRDQGGCD